MSKVDTAFRFGSRDPRTSTETGPWDTDLSLTAMMTRKEADAQVKRWNKRDKPFRVWRCEEVLPTDIDHPSRKKELTDEQLTTLGQTLLNTTNNVYRVVESMFGIEVGDEVFDGLERVAKMFKCDECNVWMPLTNRADGFDMCDSCLDEIDANLRDD